MSTIGSATRSHYDRYPYDFETALHAPMQLSGSLLGKTLELIRPGDVVVDAGCGTGLVSRLVKERTPAASVVGVDLSLGSLRRSAESSRGVSLVQGDLLRLPVRTNSVDVTISRGVIMTTGAPRQALAELARGTRPGGHLFIRVYNRSHAYRWIYMIFGPVCRAIERLPGGRALLTVFALPIFMLITQLAFVVTTGRVTRIPLKVAWNFFADQLLVPHNSFHSPDEVRQWGAAAGCRCLAHQAITLGQQIEFLFVKNTQ